MAAIDAGPDPALACVALERQASALEADDALTRAELASVGRGTPEDRVAATGLALSGGGIRSATFALGVLQALSRQGWLARFDYLSSVSGGGYCAAFVHALVRDRRLAGADQALHAAEQVLAASTVSESAELQHLRQYSNYLIPRKSLSSGDFVGTIGAFVRNVILIQTPLIAFLTALALGPYLAYWFTAQVMRRYDAVLATAAGLALFALALMMWQLARVIAAPQPAAGGNPAETTQSAPRRATGRIAGAFRRHWRSLLYVSVFLAAWLFSVFAIGAVRTGESWVAKTFVVAGGLYAATWSVVLILAALKRRVPAIVVPYGVFAAIVGGAVGAGGLYLVARSAALWTAAGTTSAFWLAYLLLPVLATLAIVLGGIFNVGLLGVSPDAALESRYRLAREYWARIGGRLSFLMIGVWLLPQALVLLGPYFVAQLAIGDWLAGHWTALAAWLVSTLAALGAARSPRTDGENRNSVLEVIATVGPYLFIAGLMVFVSFIAQQALAHWGSPIRTGATLAIYLGDLAHVAIEYPELVILAMAAGLIVWAIPGTLVDIGEFSLHAIYRNRLVRAYLGAARSEQRDPDPVGDFDPCDDFALAALHGQRPYPLINTAMNLGESSVRLDWQDRKASSFVFGPAYCGHFGTHASLARAGDESTASAGTPSPLARQIGIGQAVAISGAAVNPNMGYHTSPATAFLLTLFNVRLGDWVSNFVASRRGSFARWVQEKLGRPMFPGSFLLGELVGNLQQHFPFVHLSDGGHFENLALYELVRRRCRLIVCCDAGQDASCRFDDLANAIRKCRIDFGAEIDIDLAAMRNKVAQSAFAIGTVRYRGEVSPREGTLIYLKPTLVAALPVDVVNYASCNAQFPHQSTGDQFFDDQQFESYRHLGLVLGERMLDEYRDAMAGAEPGATARA